MPTFETTVVVAVRPEVVWPVLADVVAWPSWTPTVSRVEALEHPQLAVGRRFRVEQPGLRPAIWTVVSLEPYRQFSWRMSSLGVAVVGAHRIIPWSESATRVTLAVSIDGLLGKLVWALAGATIRAYVQQEASSLVERCLREPSSPKSIPAKPVPRTPGLHR